MQFARPPALLRAGFFIGADMATWAEKLAGALSSSPSQPTASTLGTGGAAQAANALSSRAYQMHVQEAKAMGQAPLTPQQFAAQQQQ